MAGIHRTRTVKSEIRMLRKVEIRVTLALNGDIMIDTDVTAAEG